VWPFPSGLSPAEIVLPGVISSEQTNTGLVSRGSRPPLLLRAPLVFQNVAWQVSGASFDSSGEQFQRSRLFSGSRPVFGK